MEGFIPIIIILAVIFFITFRTKSPKQTPVNKTSSTSPQVKKSDDIEWLKDRWRLAEEHKKAGDTSIFQPWYFDEVTDRQLKRLEEEGYKPSKELTKGQASDLIGMTTPADDEDLAVLKYFKISRKNMNETKVRHEIALLFQDPEKFEAWKQRPPNQTQKEEAKFFGVKLPKGTSSLQAGKLISDHQSELDENDPKFDEWDAVHEIIDELSDPDFLREDYEIKKPSFNLIVSALNELKKEGQSYRGSADDIGSVVDKLIELKPEIQRK